MRYIIAVILAISLFSLACGNSYAQEELTLTTYYPAPYGEYEKLSVGAGYSAPTAPKVDLVVEGLVGIGTDNPTTMLAIRNSDAYSDGQNSGITQGLIGFGYSLELTTSDASGQQATRALFKGGSDNPRIQFLQGGRGSEIPVISIDLEGDVGIGVTDSDLDAKLVVHGGAISHDQANIFEGTTDAIKTHVNLGISSTTGEDDQSYVYCTVGGGSANTASNSSATVAGGQNNTASGSHSAVSGGSNNNARALCSVVAGGLSNIAYEPYSVVAGGYSNIARDTHSVTNIGYSTVSGGLDNTANGNCAVVAGGYNNKAREIFSTISGGVGNKAYGCDVISGGFENTAGNSGSPAPFNTVSGGYKNKATGGGSWAGGCGAEAIHQGSFVWSDWQILTFPSVPPPGSGTPPPLPLPYTSNGDDTFNVKASGGVYFTRPLAPDPLYPWDIAEEMFVLQEDNVQEAEIVSLADDDILGKTDRAYDDNLVGVITGSRTTSLHLQMPQRVEKEGLEKRFITLVGRVYVKVNNQNGNIKVGDPITSSAASGIGMKADKTCKIVGYAMENSTFDEYGSDEILTFVNLGYYVPGDVFKRIEVLEQRIAALETK